MAALISTTDIAREAGIDTDTVRRYLAIERPKQYARAWQRFEPEELPELVALCLSKQQRRCRNRFNSVGFTQGETK